MKNNKGFMLAEVIVVSAVVISVVVSLYTGFNRVYKAYEMRSRFYDVDGLYALKAISDLLIKEGTLNNTTVSSSITASNFSNSYFFNQIKSAYQIKNVYLVKYKTIDSSSAYSLTMQDYVNFLNNSLNFSEDYNYLLLVEREVNDKYYYANLRIR